MNEIIYKIMENLKKQKYEVYELSIEDYEKEKTEKSYLTILGYDILMAYIKPDRKLEFKLTEGEWDLPIGGKVRLRPLKEEERTNMLELILNELERKTGLRD